MLSFSFTPEHPFMAALLGFGIAGVLFWLSGRLLIGLLGVCPAAPFARLFFSLLTGLVLSATLFPLIRTSGKSIHLLLLALALAGLWQGRERVRARAPVQIAFIGKGNLLVFTLLSGLLFLGNAWICFDFKALWEGGFPYRVPEQDLVAYADFSRMLLLTGQENSNGLLANLLDPAFRGISPYHFSEFWLTAFLIRLLGQNHLLTYWLIAYPLLYAVSLAGILAVWEKRSSVKPLKCLLAFMLLFAGGVYFPVYAQVWQMDKVYYMAGNLLYKFGPAEPYLIAAYWFYETGMKRESVLCLLCLPVLSFALAPALFGGLLLFAVLENYRPFPDFSAGNFFFIKTTTAVFFLSLAGMLFYACFGIEKGGISSLEEILPYFAFFELPPNEGIELLARKTAVMFALYPIKTAAAYWPFATILVVFWRSGAWDVSEKKRLLPIFSWALFSAIAGLAAAWLFALHHDSTELFRNLSFPTFGLLIGFGGTALLEKAFFAEEKQHKALAWAFFALLGYQAVFTFFEKGEETQRGAKYSASYMQKVFETIEAIGEEAPGAFIYAPSFYPESNIYSKIVRHNKPSEFLSYSQYSLGLVNLGVFEIPFSDKPQQKAVEGRLRSASVFYSFTEKQKTAGNFKGIAQSRLDFVKTRGIRFLVLGKGVKMPPLLGQTAVWICTDTVTGERFYGFPANP